MDGDVNMAGLDDRVRHAFQTQLRERQAALDAGVVRVGWKVALHIAEVEAVMGSTPAFGYLTSATQLESGGIFHARGVRALRAESEVAVELGRDVHATDDPATVRAAIAGLAAALELVDVSPPVEGFEGVVADNVYHQAFLLGTFHPIVQGTSLTASLWVNGERRALGKTDEDFAHKLLAIARLLEGVGEGMKAGDRILTGSLTHIPVQAGEEVDIEIDPLGALKVRIAGEAK